MNNKGLETKELLNQTDWILIKPENGFYPRLRIHFKTKLEVTVVLIAVFFLQTFSEQELIEAAKMNYEEVAELENFLNQPFISNPSESQSSMEIDASQVVPDPNGSQSFNGDPSQLLPSDLAFGEGQTKVRSSSMSSWQSCSSLTSGYGSDQDTLAGSPLYVDNPPLSPDRTLVNLDVLETLGPTG